MLSWLILPSNFLTHGEPWELDEVALHITSVLQTEPVPQGHVLCIANLVSVIRNMMNLNIVLLEYFVTKCLLH